jgi:ABC-2 type transport system permease protein
MRNTIAILFKELRVAFTTAVAYVVFAVFTIVSSFFFLRILTDFQRSVTVYTQMRPQALKYLNFTDQVLAPLFYNVAVLLVFAVPFLTMRLVAEERRSRSFELLMTCPVRPVHIATGKYLSALVLIGVMLLLVLIYPLLVSAYAQVGSVAWSTVASGLLGLFLLGAAFAAIGLFISALTTSQIIAAFITWCLLMLLWVIGWAANDNVGVTRAVLSGLSAVDHIRGFTRGLIAMQDLVYYLSLIVFGLFMTHRALESQRWR